MSETRLERRGRNVNNRREVRRVSASAAKGQLCSAPSTPTQINLQNKLMLITITIAQNDSFGIITIRQGPATPGFSKSTSKPAARVIPTNAHQAATQSTRPSSASPNRSSDNKVCLSLRRGQPSHRVVAKMPRTQAADPPCPSRPRIQKRTKYVTVPCAKTASLCVLSR